MSFYFGACAGGIWKTIDGGIYWRCVSDGFLGSAAIGAIAVARSDHNVIYAGTGETTIRLDVSYGDGIYKSTDAGRTWSHAGLRATKHIGRICIHPADPDIVYVAALGDTFGPNEERGVFRSRDGGETWEKVPEPQRRCRGRRYFDGPRQPEDPVRHFLGDAPKLLASLQRRTRQRVVPLDRRRRLPGRRSRAPQGCLMARSVSSASRYRLRSPAVSGC